MKADTAQALNGVMALLEQEGYIAWGFAMRRDPEGIEFLTLSSQLMSRSKIINLTQMALEHISDHSIDSIVDSLKDDSDDEDADSKLQLGEA